MAIRISLNKKTLRSGKKSAEYWMCWYEIDASTGKRRQRRKSTGCSILVAAKVIRDNLQKRLEYRKAGIDLAKEELQKLSFEEVKTAFLEVVKSECRVATHKQYQKSMALLAGICKPWSVAAITPLMVQKFKTERLKGVKKVTVDQDLRTIRRFLNWAAELGYIDRAIKIRLYNDDKAEPPKQVPRENIRLIITKLEKGEIHLHHLTAGWWVMAIRLFHFLGTRRNELMELQWSAIDLDRATATIRRVTTKSDRTGIIVLSPDMVERLTNWKQQCRPASEDELVLPRAVAIRTAYDEWCVIRKECGLPDFTWKDFRSTCGSELAENFPLSTVQSHLRHSNPSVTKKFYINDAAALRKAAAKHEPL